MTDTLRRGEVCGFDIKPDGDVELAVRMDDGEMVFVSVGRVLLAGIAEASSVYATGPLP
jgi:hypothetical protein